MRKVIEFPRFSMQERDRRWALVRAQMDRENLDCIVLWGWPAVWDFCVANARYLCPVGGNAEFNILVFPRHGDPTCYVQMPTFVEGWRRAQEWVPDVRSRKGTWADTISGRLKELGVAKGRVGMDGLAGPLDPDGWLPHSVYARLVELLPQTEIVNLDDMLEKIRSVKSAEEIAVLEQAACVGDLMLGACAEIARPGVKECEVVGGMMDALLSNGGEEPTLLLFACDQYPFPHPFRSPTTRRIEKGDYIICEMHPKYAGYYTHLERTFCIGEPDADRLRIHEGCLAAFRCGLEHFGPGKKITESMFAVKRSIDASGLVLCEAGIHGHGLASLEYPRYRHHAPGADDKAIISMGDQFRPGMVFAFNIDLMDPNWHNGDTGCCFAETVVITDDGARALHHYPQVLKALPV